MSDRPSWYTCAACKQPHTADRPLVFVAVKGDRAAYWQIHEECQSALQATLKDGVELVRT